MDLPGAVMAKMSPSERKQYEQWRENMSKTDIMSAFERELFQRWYSEGVTLTENLQNRIGHIEPGVIFNIKSNYQQFYNAQPAKWSRWRCATVQVVRYTVAGLITMSENNTLIFTWYQVTPWILTCLFASAQSCVGLFHRALHVDGEKVPSGSVARKSGKWQSVWCKITHPRM